MTKEKLIALSDLNREDNIKYISSEAQGIAITLDSDRYAPNLCKLERAYICGRRKSEEQIEQLEKEISVLLSCKNCPENKGGLLCQKEYEDKCLAQKIQYIKELKEENAELKSDNGEWEITSDKWKKVYELTDNQLTKAKEIIKDLLNLPFANNEEVFADVNSHLDRAEQFLSEVEK